MQARLALAAAKSNQTLFSDAGKCFPAKLIRGRATTSDRTAEHAVEEEDIHQMEAMHGLQRRQLPENKPTTKQQEPYIPRKPSKATAKLESLGVGPKVDPIHHQKRQNSAVAGVINDVSCAGIDGSPWPSHDGETDRRSEREDEEHYKHHKVTDKSGQSVSEGYDGNYGKGVWRPEQLDTAEESLRRAVEIFKMNAMRGDPDSPHGRVLRQLCGEDF